LVCISDSQLLICTLDRRAKAVPRKVNLPGTVNRIHYSDYLKCLAVAYIATELESDPETGIVKRYMRPHLDFLKHNLQPQGPSQAQKPVGASGERITCITDWVPESGGRQYHFLVIGTARKTQEQKGRVIFLHSRRNAENSEQIDCSVKYIHPFDGPVRAIAAYGDSTIMVAAGNDIIPVAPKLSNGGKQWAAAARFKLTSPGVSITVRGTLLYVSTARESLVILQVIENKLELYAQDGVRHESLSHQYIGGDLKVALVSSRGGTISAFSLANVTDTDKIISPAIAEAHLPVSTIRLNARESPPLRSYSSAVVVYGTTMDGAIYRILTLNEKEWRLLRFIQNLCSKDSMISPLLSARKRRWTWADIEPRMKKPSSMHVDGDILSRLIPQGTDYLRRMLQSDTQSSQLDAPAVPPPKSYMELFTNLFDDVFVDTLVEEDPLIHFMSWLRKLIQLQ
jgi:CPSF A subunit region